MIESLIMEMENDKDQYHQQAEREKGMVALSSVLAAIFLTTIKIIVGILTGSLGILSEAAHSGLDLVAAAVTFFAVRISGKPPDHAHTYGHGKIENISALFETILLLVTCVWIIYEAINRLFFRSVEVEPSIWAFVIMGISIAVDLTRSRALARVAQKYDSQALEADALHFSTDIWSSSVVILGLGLVWLSESLGITWLASADAVAAMGVAGIVIYVSLQLGKKAVADLLDAIPPGLREQIVHAVRKVPGVLEVNRVRVRRSGPEVFTDIAIQVESGTTFERAGLIASQAEAAVQNILPGADIVVKVNSQLNQANGAVTTIRSLAAQSQLGVHGIRIYEVMDHSSVEMHVEVPDHLTVLEAQVLVNAFEEQLRQTYPTYNHIATHIEPVGEAAAGRRASYADESSILEILQELGHREGMHCHFDDLLVHRTDGELNISFSCLMDPQLAITEAHSLTEQVEQELRARIPNLGRVVIHVTSLQESSED